MSIRISGGGGGGSAPPPALDADLEAIAALAPADDDVLQRKAGAWGNRTPAQIKADLALGKADVGLANVDNTSDSAKPVSTATTTALAGKADAAATTTALAGKQATNADLTAIGGLTPSNDDILQRKAGAWTNRTVAQVRADINAGAQAEGTATTASGSFSHAEGSATTASGAYGHAEGDSSTASGEASHAEGRQTVASAYYSHAEGSSAVAARYCQHAQASGTFSVAGDAQCNSFVARRQTTTATPAVLTFTGGAVTLTGALANVLTIPASKAHQFRISVVARRTDVAGEAAGWQFEGAIARDATGNARLVGTPTARAWGDAGAALWDVTLSVDTTDATNNYLAITATGEAAKTIRWVATLDTTEVG